jgi:integrase
MNQHLTDAMIRKLVPPLSGMAAVWDQSCKGFGIRITASGARAFLLNYRHQGRQRQITLGSFPTWSTSQARIRARELQRQVDSGTDPLGERQAALSAPTVNDLCQNYITHRLPSLRASSQRANMGYMRRYILPAIGSRKVASVSHADIASLHGKIRAPIMGNRVLSMLSTLFGLAIKLEMIERSPTRGVERHAEHSRQRYLSGDEISRLMSVLDHHQHSSANVIRLLLLTGARKGEILGAEWSQFDLEQGVWVKPFASTKQNREHRIPLSADALAILRAMREKVDERVALAKKQGRILRITHLFPGHKQNPHRNFIHSFWKAVCKEAGIEGVRVHDLRHTHASILVSSGASLPLIGSLLGHTQPSTTNRYAHLLDQPLRDAVDLVGRAVVGARPTVVSLKR